MVCIGWDSIWIVGPGDANADGFAGQTITVPFMSRYYFYAFRNRKVCLGFDRQPYAFDFIPFNLKEAENLKSVYQVRMLDKTITYNGDLQWMSINF